VLSALIG